MYEIQKTKHFQRIYKKIVKKNKLLAKKIETVFMQISEDPFQKSLRTHQVNTKLFGKRWSSRITGDLRVVWDFIENKKVILVLTLGGHSGGTVVYK